MSGTLRSSLAEFAGTFALVWLAASAAANGPVAGALAYGMALWMLTFAFGGATEAHFNPAITAALCLTKRLDAVRGVLFAFCQILGAGLAGVFLVRTAHAGAASGVCELSN